MNYRSLSLWHDTLPEGLPVPRSPLDGSIRADVAIVGAGYTGLWASYYLKLLQPDLRIVVIEAEIAGFGASGRNGGWASGEFALNMRTATGSYGESGVQSLFRTVFASIDEIGSVCRREGIDSDFHKGGTVTFATSPAQVARLQKLVGAERDAGFGEDDVRWLDAAETALVGSTEQALGSVFTPHCAAIHPGKLARGLASVVERMGVEIYEQTAATSIEPGMVVTRTGSVLSPVILTCTEAFSVSLPGRRRDVAPIYSLMIATEPLSQEIWDEIGLADRPTFNDARHLVIYGQRTADGRLAFGGRGAPYHFGSKIKRSYEQDDATHQNIAEVLRWLFPQIGGAQITHRWGGAVAVPRDWNASISFDRASGLGRAGGYVGAGVTASNLGGRTLADLVLRRETDLVHLPWVGHRSRRWEPEPLRFVGINAGRALAPWADRRELRSGKPSRVLGGALKLLTGH